MTRLYYDTEFIEDGRTIDLISIGIVAEDGREYYAVSSDAPWDRIRKSDWLIRNVLPSLPLDGRKSLDAYLAVSRNSYPKPGLQFVGPDLTSTQVKPHQVVANEVRDFILGRPDPQLWADYGAYDHVVLCQLWGSMASLPEGVPMWTHDLRQEAERLGSPELPDGPAQHVEHNALYDARQCQLRHQWLMARGL